MNDATIAEIRQKFKQAGQGHVFDYFEGLDEASQSHLLKQTAEIDLDALQSLAEKHLSTTGDSSNQSSLEGLAPAPYTRLPKNEGDPTEWQAAANAGSEAIAAGKVAAFTVAGGQGTRLGYDGPKGTFPVTPVSEMISLAR